MYEGITTKSFGFTPIEMRPNCKAEVPEAVATVLSLSIPIFNAISSSNLFIKGPTVETKFVVIHSVKYSTKAIQA